MLKELSNFTQSLDADLKGIGIEPREGLHIVLSLEELPDGSFQIAEGVDYELFRKRKTDASELQRKCAAWARSAWMVDTNKCFDLPAKKIHSCSPFCLAFKYGSSLRDTQLEVYFTKAAKLLRDDQSSRYAKAFRQALNDWDKIQQLLGQIPEANLPENADKEAKSRALKEGEYVIFYLDTALETYQSPNALYLQDRLFNTNEYNAAVGEEVFGTSAFFNGFPTKKPFLTHQTAPFNVAGRISASDALRLHEFNELISRNIFPRPLPIFIYNDELRQHSFNLFKEEAVKDPTQRKIHAQIITELYAKHKDELGNYYLLYYQQGQIKDFDFVAKFEYHLTDEQGDPWSVEDWFNVGYAPVYNDVFKFQNDLLPVIFNNALVVRLKAKKDETTAFQLRFFDDIDPLYCKTDNTYLLVMKYRRAFYDFIYKSKRQAVTQLMLEDILLTGIMDDLRLDRYENRQHSEDANLRRKLNVLFSLHSQFQPHQFNPIFMPSQLNELRPFMSRLATGEGSIDTDEQFAFAAGQVIYYIQSKSKSEDRSYARLEPFLQQTDVKQFQQAVIKLFDRYKHEPYSARFREPMANVVSYIPQQPIKTLMPLLLAGFFSKNVLFGEKPNNGENPQDQDTNEQ
jgi:CRISPR-associated protein Csh1